MFSTIMTNDGATLVQRELIDTLFVKKKSLGNGLPYLIFYILNFRNKNSDSADHKSI